MDPQMVHRSSVPMPMPMPQPWGQPYPYSAPPNPNRSRPLTAPYPSHDPNSAYDAPGLYPTVVSQQMPQRYTQPPPLPNTLTPGGFRPRTRSSIGDNIPFVETPPPLPQFPSFPSPSPIQYTQPPPFPQFPVPPSKPPALQPPLSEYPFPVVSQAHNEPLIRPPPTSARRSSSSPAIGRTPTPNPPPPVPPLPPTMNPGYPQHAPHHISPVPPPSSIPIPPSNQPYRSNSSPLYASPFETAPPPSYAPPPPHFSSPPRGPAASPPRPQTDVKQAPVDDEEDAIAIALALSEKESKEQSRKASKEEEEDLAKAIEESIRHAAKFGMPAEAGSSTSPPTVSPLSFSTPLPVSESPISPHMPHASQHGPRLSVPRPAGTASSPLMRPVQHSIDDDEALAKRLAEEERLTVAGQSDLQPKPPSVPPYTRSEFTTSPAPAPAPAPPPNSWGRHNMPRPKISTDESEPPPPLYHHAITPSPNPGPTQTSPTSLNNSPSLGRSSSASVVVPSPSRLSPLPDKIEKPNNGRSQSWDSVPNSSSATRLSPTAPPKSSSLPTVIESLDSPTVQSPSSSAGPSSLGPNANSFLDQQLLNGVSLGFNPPQISSIKTTLKGGVPNVISLPTGKFVPFHIQAPDWRHLLKMMARLSGSRIEASIEAMAGTKQELKLRTVVQFVRVNTASEDWRTVLYLTIDNPPPSNAPHKFTNGDVNILPFSYSTSPLPALLRDGPDAPMSKFYTIPATPNTPYPTLPISFPNMAMYLASALEDSRRMVHDNSSGMKRLAKTLDTFYPAEVELGMEDDEPEQPPGGVMNMFRNVFGKGRKDQRRNDNNYADLVTPFVPEWG